MYAFLPRTLPKGLEPLTELALDLRWTWSHAADALWSRLDPEIWERTHNPWMILQNVSQSRLDAVMQDAGFMQLLDQAVTERQRYLQEPGWCRQGYDGPPLAPIAYFSMEFGLGEAFPLYAGGLGVLAGDYLKTASDLDVPVTGIGLLYQEGYFRQVLDAAGEQREAYPYNDPTGLPIQPTLDAQGGWLKVRLHLPGRPLHLRVWHANVGRVKLYLLDSNDLSNGAADRGITAKLYGGDQEMRVLQEIALGIGGCALLDLLGIPAQIYHLNEGHAALAVLERVRRFMKKTGAHFWDAWWASSAGNVFTTHTPVAAGFDAFPPELVRKYAGDYQKEFGLSLRELLALGRQNPEDDREAFNMAYLAVRGALYVNAVSALHGEVSRRLFAGLYPRWPQEEVPIGHVTNGVHVPSWDSIHADRLWTQLCGKQRWLGATEKLEEGLARVDDETLWDMAVEQRRDLVHFARQRLAWQLGQRGESPAHVAEAQQALDPNVLTLGFARRFATYKRPNLLLTDPERFARLLLDERRPVQIIVAGKAHPADEAGKRLVADWVRFARRHDVRLRVVFLVDYDMHVAQHLVQGVDLWINTPRRPWEACGTSGMKVLANGGLNLSSLDGWWAEAYAPERGWAIGDRLEHEDGVQDAHDAEQLYRLLEDQVAPEFYERDAAGIPRAWIRRVRASMAGLAPQYSSNRMMRDYISGYYAPATAAIGRRSADGAALARGLSAWRGALAANWSQLHFGDLAVQGGQGRWQFRVPVYLGEVQPDAVRVELYAAARDGEPAVRQAMTREAAIPGTANGYLFTAEVDAGRPAGDFTPRVIPWHEAVVVPAEASLIAWQR